VSLPILEAAANVRQAMLELEAICAQLRDAGADWTMYAIAAEDAMKIADDGLRNCRTALGSIKGLALREFKPSKLDKVTP
jgi:hypothetical protein